MGNIYDEMIKETKHLFQNSKSVKYWPYIGKGYFECATKILVLGESHYLTDPSRVKEMENYSGWTNEVIIWGYLDQEYCQNFSSFDDFPKWISLPKDSYLKGFRNTAKMLVQNVYSNNAYTKLGDDYVWKNLAFYNFFQRPVACRPGCHEWLKADYDNYIKQACAALYEVMDNLKPNVVIIWGEGDFYKDWLPSDMVQRYPQVKFFPINHPSYNIKKEYIGKWKNFVNEHKINERYADFHPCHKRIESIFSNKRLNECFKRVKSIFPPKKEKNPDPCCCWFSERSIGYWLCLDANESNAMILLVTMNENEEMTITFSTRHGSELVSASILNHPSFDAFVKKRNLNCDGLFELCRVASNADDDAIVSSILKVLEAFENFGKSFMMNKFF